MNVLFVEELVRETG